MLPQHGPMSRTYQFIKHLNKRGCEATAFVGSHPHNSPLQLVEGRKKYALSHECEYPWVLVRTCNYEDGRPLRGPRRIWSIIQYFFNLFATAKHFDKPDVIIGSSAPPFTALAAVLLAKRYKCKSVFYCLRRIFIIFQFGMKKNFSRAFFCHPENGFQKLASS